MNILLKMKGQATTTHQEIALKLINLLSVGTRNFEEIEGKFREFVKYVHQDFILIMLPYRDPTEFHGVEGLWQIIKENKDGLSDFDIEVIDIYGEHSSIAVRVIYRGTHAGLMLGMHSTGKKIVNESVHLFKFKEDKLIELRVISDTLTIFMQLGQAIILQNEQEQIDEYFKILRNLGLLPKT